MNLGGCWLRTDTNFYCFPVQRKMVPIFKQYFLFRLTRIATEREGKLILSRHNSSCVVSFSKKKNLLLTVENHVLNKIHPLTANSHFQNPLLEVEICPSAFNKSKIIWRKKKKEKDREKGVKHVYHDHTLICANKFVSPVLIICN
jgi:hypothetical protein